MVQKLVFGMVSRFLGISCDFFIFSVSIDINIENIFGVYITRKETGKVKKEKRNKNNHALI